MKKIILLFLFFTLCCSGVAFSDDSKQLETTKTDEAIDLDDYRSNPFQWVFVEYYYKAETIRIEKEKTPPQGYTKVEFFGLSAYIPSEYAEEIKKYDDVIYFKAKNKDMIMMVKSPNDSIMCSEASQINDKDYCSAFKTPQEYYHKLFTLAPDMVGNTGDKWIVHAKGFAFKNTKKIEIYSGDKFMAYVEFIKKSLTKETKFSHEITLFHVNGPLNSHVIISFLANDDTILKNFLSTLE
jgi:hypothetical protein